MKKQFFIVLIIAATLLVVMQASLAQLDLDRAQRLKYGHVIRIEDVGTEPPEIPPGGEGTLKMSIRNSGEFQLSDIRVKATLPSQIAFLNDISRKKVATLEPGASKNLEFNIIALPEVSEGVYTVYLTVDYLNQIGDEKSENDTFAIIVRSEPRLFVKIDDSEIYQGNSLGDVTVTFVNNDVADIKFLTTELQESGDYEIISSYKKYIGDLDSDDFESVDFRLELKTKKREVPLLLKVTYKDSLNNDYSEDLTVILDVRSAEELGIKTNTTIFIALGVIIVLVVLFFLYRMYRKRKYNHYTKDGLILPRNEKHHRKKRR